MEYRRLGTTGLMVSELCLGCMTFGRDLDQEGSKIISRFLGAGGSFIDTADVQEGAPPRRSLRGTAPDGGTSEKYVG
jgi:aryl-alcohol dehydrogenase-like predicted oxidoreductase